MGTNRTIRGATLCAIAVVTGFAVCIAPAGAVGRALSFDDAGLNISLNAYPTIPDNPVGFRPRLFATAIGWDEVWLRDEKVCNLASDINFRSGSLGMVPVFIRFIDEHGVRLMTDDAENDIRRAVDDMMEEVGSLNSLMGRFESLFECEELVSLTDNITGTWYWQNSAFMDENSVPRWRLSVTRMDKARKNRITVFGDFTDLGVHALLGIMFGTLL